MVEGLEMICFQIISNVGGSAFQLHRGNPESEAGRL